MPDMPVSPESPPLAPLDVADLVIEGLDVNAGLLHVFGRKPLYLSLLRKFAAGQGEAVRDIRQALDTDDWEAAERTAHTLKGIAATLGANTLQVLAGDANDRILARSPRADIDAVLNRLEPVLAGLTEALRRV